jgi:hypothetical protein
MHAPNFTSPSPAYSLLLALLLLLSCKHTEKDKGTSAATASQNETVLTSIELNQRITEKETNLHLEFPETPALTKMRKIWNPEKRGLILHLHITYKVAPKGFYYLSFPKGGNKLNSDLEAQELGTMSFYGARDAKGDGLETDDFVFDVSKIFDLRWFGGSADLVLERAADQGDEIILRKVVLEQYEH